MTLLDVKRLSIYMGAKKIVDQINFQVGHGECVGLVGESGCGKSLTALSLIYPMGVVEGEVLFNGVDLLRQSPKEMQKVRKELMGMVFQEPLTALNPLLTIGRQLTEGGRTTAVRAAALLARVGVDEPERRMKQYPHELSGGQRQRVLLAMALGPSPKLLIADEPTTALDVSVQVEVCTLLKELQQEGLSILFISHDLAVVRQITQRVLVMREGKIVEDASTEQLFKYPQHLYTQQLLQWRAQCF